MEKNIAEYIIGSECSSIDISYLSLYIQKNNASSIKDKSSPTIIVDELLQYTLISFYFSIFSLMYNSNPDNFEKCFKNCVVLLDLQGNKHEIGTHNTDDLLDISHLPEKTINLIMDAYWMSWTFIFSHELYHLISKVDSTSIQEELDADKYAYIKLISMIESQAKEQLPKEIQVFYDYLYLSPMMLMEYFKLLDFYNGLFDKKTIYTDHPSPDDRQNHLFSLFDDIIPDDFDTEIGNDLFNCFLDQIDIIREQLQIKK